MKFVLTIDAEADNQWRHGIPISTENIRFIPRFQRLCDQHQVTPTYLVTSEVCEDQFAQRIFKEYIEKGTAEIGAHLHSWTTPPFEEREGMRFNDFYHPFATELPESLLDQKVETLTGQIQKNLGISPTSFRSGRFGFDETCAKVLTKYRYKVDSSVTPYVNWSRTVGMPNGKGGPDFSGFPSHHYFMQTDYGTLLEIPVTILPTRWPLRGNDSLARFLCSRKESLGKKIVRRILFPGQPVWLRPSSLTTIDVFRDLVGEADSRSLEFLTMMFHSSELMPGCSPSMKTELDIEHLYTLLEAFFAMLNSRGIDSITLSDCPNYCSVQ